MSSYFYLWQASEHGKDLMLPALFLALVIQIICYSWLKHHQSKRLTLYTVGVMLADLIVAIQIGVQIK